VKPVSEWSSDELRVWGGDDGDEMYASYAALGREVIRMREQVAYLAGVVAEQKDTVDRVLAVLRDPPVPSRMLVPVLLGVIFPEEY
jgi:hypothetical protein